MRYKIHMLFTTGWWIVGFVTLIYVFIPILSLLLSTGTHHAWLPTSVLAFLFVYVFCGISLIFISLKNRVKNEKVQFRDALIQYSLIVNSSFIYTRAAINALLLKRYIGFIRTNKQATASGISLIKLNLGVALLCLAFSLYALYYSFIAVTPDQFRTYFPISLWLLFYSLIFFSSVFFVGKKGAGNG